MNLGKGFILMGLSLSLVNCSMAKPLPSDREGYLDHGRQPAQEHADGISRNSADFQWPLRNIQVTSPYGKRGKEFHEGIDLRAPAGTPVFASQTGKVLYVGSKIRGYGNLVVIRHPGKVATIYAHNSKILVKKGLWVHQGQKIALSGSTGHSHGAHLHFEIRRGMSALDPLGYLPRNLRKI